MTLVFHTSAPLTQFRGAGKFVTNFTGIASGNMDLDSFKHTLDQLS